MDDHEEPPVVDGGSIVVDQEPMHDHHESRRDLGELVVAHGELMNDTEEWVGVERSTGKMDSLGAGKRLGWVDRIRICRCLRPNPLTWTCVDAFRIHDFPSQMD